MISEAESTKNKQNVVSLLVFRYDLSIKASITISEVWLQEHPEDSWLSLYQLLQSGKVIYKAENLLDISQIPLEILRCITEEMRGRDGVEIKDRWYNLILYADCFIGSEAVGWLAHNQKMTREEAVELGKTLLERGLIAHVCGDHAFKDDFLFYHFLKT